MNEKELRIGNWIEGRSDSKKDFVTFQVYRETFFDIDSAYGEFKPIPLTEEWLLKFGFQFYFIGNGDYKSKQWYFEDFTLCGFNYYYNLEINYIHQLQNLFFAIKGKELIYNNEGTKKNNQMD